MREEYDLSDATRGAVVKELGKQRITIMLDSDILAAFRERAAGSRRGYQTLINSEKTGLLGGTDVIGADCLDGEAYGGARGP